MHKIRRISLLLAFTLLVSACSTRFMYRQLDWLIPWYVDDFVTLDEAQEQQLDGAIERLLEWHRAYQLPRYAGFLRGIADSVGEGLSNDDLDLLINQTRLFTDELAVQAAVELVPVIQTLSDEQISELFSNIDQVNEEYRKKYIDTPEIRRRDKRRKDMEKQIKRWTAELDERQLVLIDVWSEQYELMGLEFLNSRLAWQQELQRVLMVRKNEDLFASRFQQLAVSRRLGRSELFQQKFDTNQTLLKALYADIDNSLTSYQRRQIQNRLHSLADDFVRLAEGN